MAECDTGFLQGVFVAKRNCILRDCYYVPIERVPNYKMVLRDMRVDPKWFNTKEPRPKPIFQCFQTEDDYIAFPVHYGMTTYPDPDMIVDLSRGQPLHAPTRPDPFHEKASPGQDQFFKTTLEHFANNPVGVIIAATGTGKTANALNLIAERGRSACVVTDRTYLGFEQWIPEAKAKIGLTDDQIGIIQGDKCEYHKPFVVAIAASLYSRDDYPEEMYSAFGTVVFDELHKFGAAEMQRILSMFNAEVRAGQTATDKRKDGCHKIYLDHLGNGQVRATGQALRCQLRVVDYHDHTGQKLGSTHGARMTALSWNKERNEIIVREIIKMYNDGRNILVIGDDIRHLQRLEQMCWKAGVMDDRTGQFSRERYIMTKEPGEHNGQKAIIQRMKKARVTNDYLNWVKAHARIIFATYGMMKEGIDIPRLDGGIDATPRTEARQVIGRIRRPLPGKKVPLWVTIRDRSHFALERYYEERLADCLQANVELLHD